MGDPGAKIIAVWVRPEFRKQGVGTAILRALSEQSQCAYGEVPSYEAVTFAGVGMCRRAVREGVQMTFTECPAGDLP